MLSLCGEVFKLIGQARAKDLEPIDRLLINLKKVGQLISKVGQLNLKVGQLI